LEPLTLCAAASQISGEFDTDHGRAAVALQDCVDDLAQLCEGAYHRRIGQVGEDVLDRREEVVSLVETPVIGIGLLDRKLDVQALFQVGEEVGQRTSRKAAIAVGQSSVGELPRLLFLQSPNLSSTPFEGL